MKAVAVVVVEGQRPDCAGEVTGVPQIKVGVVQVAYDQQVQVSVPVIVTPCNPCGAAAVVGVAHTGVGRYIGK